MTRLGLLSIALLLGVAPLAARAEAPPTYEQPLSESAIHDVQVRLRALGYYGGSDDGVWGPSTRRALQRFQSDHHLAVTGQLNPASARAMGLDPNRLVARSYEPPPPRERVVREYPVGPETTRAVQWRLRRLGYYRGPVDGAWGPGTRYALRAFERDRNLPLTDEPTRDTMAAMGLRSEDFMSGSSVR